MDYFKLKVSPLNALYFIVGKLVRLYPRIKYEFKSTNFSVNLRQENQNEDNDEGEESNIGESKYDFIDIAIDFYDYGEETIVQMIKGDYMDYIEFKNFYKDFNVQLVKQENEDN